MVKKHLRHAHDDVYIESRRYNLVCRYYHNLVLDSFLIMFGHLVWALLSTALVFTLLGMVGGIVIKLLLLTFNRLIMTIFKVFISFS